jgi:excisionase family DNA binding protein
LRSSSESTNEQAERLLSVEEVARALSLSKTSTYALCWEGHLPSVKLGRRRMIRRSDLIAYIESLENSGA